MKELINQHTQPIPLESGIVLAAAGSDGSVRRVETLSEGDQRRYVDRGLIAVREVELESTASPIAAAPTADRRPSTVADSKKETKS